MLFSYLAMLLGAILASLAARRIFVVLSTMPALAWTPIGSRRLSGWVQQRDYDTNEFLAADGAGEPWLCAGGTVSSD